MTFSTINLSFVTLAIAGAVSSGATAVVEGSDDHEVHANSVFIVDGGDDAHPIAVHVDNDDVRVVLDGEEIAAERIRIEDGRIYITDEDGEERPLGGVFVGGDAAHAWAIEGGDGESVRAWARAFGGAGGSTWEQPSVMMGVNMGQPGKALEYHLGLDPGASTMVVGLYKHLPADDAGLEPYDIIVAIDGQEPADPASVREALADLEPGDSINLTVIQAGNTRRVRIVLDEFDEERMGEAEVIGQSPGMDFEFMPFGGGGSGRIQVQPFGGGGDFFVDPDNNQLQWFRFDQDRLRNLDRSLRDLDKKLGHRDPDDLDDRLERLNDRLERMQDMLDELIDQTRDQPEGRRRR